MNEREFTILMNRARVSPGDYSTGYQRGLCRHYYGQHFRTAAEYERWMRLGIDGAPGNELWRGYRDGFAGRAPAER